MDGRVSGGTGLRHTKGQKLESTDKPRPMANGILKASYWWDIKKRGGYTKCVSAARNHTQICHVRGVDIIQ